MAIPTMKTLTILGEGFEIVDEIARGNVEKLRSDVDDIIADSLIVFSGATADTAGVKGLVPSPAAGDQDKYLMGNGTWAEAANKEVENNVATLTSNVGELSDNFSNHVGNYNNPHQVTIEQIGAAADDHGHNYAGSASAGGPANSVANSLKIQGNGNELSVFDGSSEKTVNITYEKVGAAAAVHGTHVSYGDSASELASVASAGSSESVSRSDHKHPFPSLSNCIGTLGIEKGGTGGTDKSSARIGIGIRSGTTLPDDSDGELGDVFFLYQASE